MQTTRPIVPKFVFRTVAACALAGAVALPALAADRAGGRIVLGKHTATVAHATLVRGPDEMDPGKTILRLYLSSDDIRARVKSCKTLSCSDGLVGATGGGYVDYGDASHLGYWVALDNEMAQYSGGTDQAAFRLKINQPDRLAGHLHVDDTATGGPMIDADFDAAVAVTVKSAD
jgi:hypothetical protein